MGFIWFHLRKGCACFPDKATSGTTTPRLPTALEGVYGDRFPPPSLPVRPAFVLGASRLSYSSLDGVLFDKTQTTLIRFPFGRLGDYTIPDSVTRIEYSAFMGCGGLTSVTIPDSVTSVGASAFRDCESLERIVFEGDAAEVGEAAFRDLSSNAKIFINPEAKGFGSRFEGLPVEFLPKEVEISTVSTGVAPFSFTIETEPDTAYRIDSTSDLSPEGRWTKIGSIQGSGEPVEFTDTREALFLMQFYRVLSVE